MRYQDFIDAVRENGDLATDAAAHDAAEATMQTLGERISAGEAKPIADQLPDDLAGPLLTAGGNAEAFQPSEFVDRVDRRQDETWDDTERHVRAVLEALSERLEGAEWRDARKQLPPEYDALYETVDSDTRA